MPLAGFYLDRMPANLGPRDIGTLPDHALTKIHGGEAALKVVREWRGLTQDDLADRTGISITQIQRAEKGGDISRTALCYLARGLRVADGLLTG